MLHRRDLLKIAAAVGTAVLNPVLARSARAQAVTLDVLYAFPAFAKFHEPIAQEFMKRQSDIKIQFRAPAASYDEGHQTMLRQAVTNQLPDVYYSGYHLLAELVRTLVKRNQITEVAPMLRKKMLHGAKRTIPTGYSRSARSTARCTASPSMPRCRSSISTSNSSRPRAATRTRCPTTGPT